jgi:uncharacterized protein (TIGR03663 family)
MILMLVAAAFRFPLLADRPMHCDEAVNADKFGLLLDHKGFEYSAVDYHGPTLYYLSVISARSRGLTHFADLDEVTLRSVPAFLGVLLVGAHFFLIPYLGLTASAIAAILAAVSPAMVYYSRDYIHEMLFVLLTFCALVAAFRYSEKRDALHACSVGVLVGLMYATKETAILPLGCFVLAALLFRGLRRVPVRHLLPAFGAAFVVVLVLMSSFFAHPRGIIDSVLAYRTYVARGAGIQTPHVHPWSYYLSHLLFYRAAGGPVWSEALIGLLAVAGVWTAFTKNRSFARVIAIYTLLMMTAYSLIPYKAPWNLLGFWHGAILMAGLGAAALLDANRGRLFQAVLGILLVAGTLHLGWQAWSASTRYSSDPRNPWVYGHTGPDIYRVARALDVLAAAYPGGHTLPISIISRENLWPLPWYLRRFSAVRWWNGVSDTEPVTPVILLTPDMEPALARRLYELTPTGEREMYLSMFDRYTELRPQVELRGYVVKSLWETP